MQRHVAFLPSHIHTKNVNINTNFIMVQTLTRKKYKDKNLEISGHNEKQPEIGFMLKKTKNNFILKFSKKET